MLTGNVLVLNRAFYPVHVTNVRRALCLMYTGLAKAINEKYEMFDFQSWSELSMSVRGDKVAAVDRAILVPRVLVLSAYDRVPRRNVRFSRHNIFLRDRNTCQYCGRVLPASELNLDHVVPRSQGGGTTWENIVCSCLPCNKKKGGKRPEEAGMRLHRPPGRPRWTQGHGFGLRSPVHKEWIPFLDVVNFSYWNLELDR